MYNDKYKKWNIRKWNSPFLKRNWKVNSTIVMAAKYKELDGRTMYDLKRGLWQARRINALMREIDEANRINEQKIDEQDALDHKDAARDVHRVLQVEYDRHGQSESQGEKCRALLGAAMKNLRLSLSCLGLGIATDLLVVLYYRAIQARQIPHAMLLSILVTAIPMLIVNKGIEAKSKALYLWYAAGCSVGTAAGLLI
ncbi:MAG: hypothetical protein MZV63_15655 [Marinilabiliales bacterium]|nr:hypothetical protein [Marinilabiliales bacterium]